MKLKKYKLTVLLGFMVAVITIFQPFMTIAVLTATEIADIATEVTIRITGVSNGSGVIIGRNENTYTVLTNSHIFENHPTGKFEIITPDGRKHQLNNLRKIPNLDLATLEFNSIQEYTAVKLGDSEKITRGKDIYVSGFPANQDLNFSTDRITRIITKARPGGYALVYRIGAFPGMSGGPILDSDGKLVGIHGETQSVSVVPGRSTPEEYGIPIQSYLNTLSLPRKFIYTPQKFIRYTNLENLLKFKKFKEADIETDKFILAVANREIDGLLGIEDAKNFPCQELRRIDELWLKYSDGKFGISVQQEIYKNLGGTKEFNSDKFRSFGDKVGWRKSGNWTPYNELSFLISAPAGHLPHGKIGWADLLRLFDPVKTCKP
ncbi:hypothetical protein CEP10_16290 [Cylindrospermopsis raciborskii S07]|nr:hypothetical protein CEP11_18555 [Cylindrospermopsis raciborskii S10]PNK02800.1 hypothetical protein CEP10_16290 [Cylindrospermopsis raciborskii S07]PNK04044.1 hypothetical protein CEP12_13455 [Cylindrospermopsis raciborskii S14]PNK14535.1 hypothetical protein CEP09_11885 [Cylindrospermopsis raciborskii S06]PNK16840.1 hypothetical protein CEP08_10860 [Cylindrospermopsis raciborskii S05]